MTLSAPRFNVLLEDADGNTTEHETRILHGDQLRAELEAPKHGLTDMSAAPMHFTTLWIWAALTRTHVIDEDFRTFKGHLVTLEAADDADGNGDEVGPTQTGAATG